MIHTKLKTFAAALLAGTVLTGSTALADTTIRFSTTLPDGNAVVTGILEPWAEAVNGAGVGLTVEVINGSTIASGANVLDRIADGIVDAGWVLPGYTGSPFPKTLVIGLPFLAETPNGGTAGLKALLDAGLIDDEFGSVHVLGLGAIPTNGLHTKEPVTTLEDASGLKLRVADAVGADIASAIGGSGISMPITEAYQAISQGVVDGIITGWTGTFVFHLQEVVGNHLEVPLGQQPSGIFMNLDTWDSLTDEQKDALGKGPNGGDLGAFIGNWYDQADNRFKTMILDAGGTLNELSEDERARWEDKLAGVTEAWLAATPDGQQVLDTFKEGVATVE